MASVTVIGPDKKTYEFPEGTTKDAAVAYFKRKGIGIAAPQSPELPAPSSGPTQIGPSSPSIWQRVKAGITGGIPYFEEKRGEVGREGPPKMQLLSPESAMSETEQRRHPILTGLAQFTGAMTTPGNAALMAASGGLGGLPGVAGRLLPRLIAGGFSAQMLWNAYHTVPDIRKAADRGDTSEVERLLTMLTLQTGMGYLAGRGALLSRVKAGVAPIETSPETASVEAVPPEAQVALPAASEPLTKAARIEEAAVKERPDWEAQERVHDQARLEAIVRNPEVSSEERNAAARSLEAGYPESTTALARRVAEGRIAIGEGGLDQARFIRSGQLGGVPPEPPTPPTEALVPPSGGPPPPAPPAETPMERDWSQFAKSATLQRSAQEVRANKVLATAFDYARRALAKLPYAERQEWANNMDEGIYQTGGILRRASEEAHNALNSLRDEMRRLNPAVLREYYENYWPRQWEMPNAAKQIYDSIRGIKGYRGGSLRGRASFLKPRTLLDEAGEPVSRRVAIDQFHMKPAYNNPIDEFMAKAAEMNRFIHGQNILNDLRDAGAKQTFLSARQVPEGWDQYDPRYAGPNQYGPAAAVRVLNRYMRPSAFDSSDPYIRMGLTPLRAFNILSNQLAVSLSLFHAGLNITSGLVGDLGRALRHVPDLAEMGRSLSARSTILDIIRAGKWQEAYRTPGIHGTEMERMIQQMLKGGAKPELDDFYRLNSTKRFLKAIEDHNPWGASARAIPALLEQLSRPIMDWLVPRVKMMAIMRDVETDLENNPNASDDELREMFARSVKSVDDWHGQMDRTNLVIHGWNRTMADALGTAFRFVEFSYGTMRGMYGAVSDLNLLRKGHLTPRLARAIAFPIVMYTMGATLQLMLTGKWPHDGDTPLRDGFEPRTGRINPDGTPERMELPTYWRTAVQWSAPTRDLLRGDLDEATTDLESALRGRLSGGVDSIIMWATNKDFYGRQVRQPHLELEKYLRPFAQLVDYAKAEVRENEPISLHYVQQARERGEGARSIALRLAGIQPVPARENRSAAENKIAEFLAENMGDRPLTPEEYAARRTRSDIRAQLRSGKLPPSFASAITSHTINPARVAKFVEDARKSYYDRATELTPEQFLQVWELATPDERTKMKVPLYREYRRLMLGPLDERAKLLVPFQRALMEAR